MAQPAAYDIDGVDLTDDQYTVEQGFIRGSKYKAVDRAGNVVLRAKKKKFKLKEEFPFVDADGNDVFQIKAGGVMDVAGNYILKDARTGEDILVLDNDYSLFRDEWTIRDARTDAEIAEIESQGALTTIARYVLPFGGFIPYEFEITDANGTHVGNIEGHLSLQDRYDITIDDSTGVPKEAVVAAAMVIDAIQGN